MASLFYFQDRNSKAYYNCIQTDLQMSTEKRFCDKCMQRTEHDVVEDPEAIYTYKRRRKYVCSQCKHSSFKRGLRPSAESVY
ncbi:MAG: hypothetical protein DA330_03775 [Nitrososphaera sp.]|nr:hypothetical protein [Nitrososphaera sp.]